MTLVIFPMHFLYKFHTNAKKDVRCHVACAFCPTISHHVAALKRHSLDCPERKKKRDLPEFARKVEDMRIQRDAESKKASNKAREALEAHKRPPDLDPLPAKSWKKARLGTHSGIPTDSTANLGSTANDVNCIINTEPSGSHAHTNDQCAASQATAILASALWSDKTNQPFDYPPSTDLDLYNSGALSDTLGFSKSTVDSSYVNLDLQDTPLPTADSRIGNNMPDNPSRCVYNQFSTRQDTTVATRAESLMSDTMDGLYTNNLSPTTQNSIPATVISSLYHPSNQHSITPEAATATRAWSFVDQTIDGSAMYIDGQMSELRGGTMLQDPPLWQSA
ncbi:hypothetical protein F5Y17DRAFT_156982 [Xylariaceae sp. FL0594]|nr:hypothetical protein F5Y17DRAFT_156982 [Xylariaceae sp. FL0594]